MNHVVVAVVPFKAAVMLELKRRGNDHKVMALYLQMQEMMSTLLSCVKLLPVLSTYHVFIHDILLRRRLKPLSEEQLVNQGPIREQMKTRLDQVAKDIERCANACDSFQRKRLIGT